MIKHTAAPDTTFELVSGLEIHVQLNTNTKIFSSDSAAFGAGPNAHISPVSLALPGALPKLNKEVVAKAVRMGLALNCHINQTNFFDRKNYFYADLPKGYQITQDKLPVCQNGFIDLTLQDGSVKRIGINRIHMEEDAGKSMHDQHDQYSFVDLNRAGVPLIEIVTEPDIRSAEEASVLLTEMRKLVRHLEVSDGNMEEGSLRCDANISIREIGSSTYGTRCEVKNLNSIRNVRRAMDFEFNRQRELIAAGGVIQQSTLTFDAEQGTTAPMRTKEEANDYRYFPDPDLPPIYISDEWLAQMKAAMPLLPAAISAALQQQYGISAAEATIFAEDKELMQYFQDALPGVSAPKTLINWLSGPVRALLNEQHLTIGAYQVKPLALSEVITLVESRKINQHAALHQLLPELQQHPEHGVAEIAEKLNLFLEDNTTELSGFADQVLEKYAAQAAAYKKGKKGVLGLFVGEVMKMANGKADPQQLNQLLQEKLK
ncbi:Asp-tRNA(Asn)/Glu-tRNA(Gln) amidotransferase subunit GatB [Pedobacter antarcticus]|uniref:Aspartyl/glutamyl-tRNA(Asn/Gln) amidotransferase subunit B n=2 Tax=Pedobacter antarcticus TaxID=34086 RepID=A0A081PHF6_9SPHI|nr:Asp-tRNA(Asn)/Glu-tRNA(Gln) amidotransferase subunit GatB [Pedobacter antarcticus]KEQ30129.1 glutamyl-tRNA amidotransferase [Pedobacter antarcticus 4BY]SDL36443.1 aspartyl/glutamyl-tRNA(Asn/Gln) amidotransferase subunit B [Pedobacter antarcticus]SFE49077.1 aspartyl/glutamyl-tRNA(Asn/Gln) amidotransferase subunit B [Pedobacter antarcticus]